MRRLLTGKSTVQAQYDHKRQRQRINEKYPSQWAIAVGVVVVVVAAVVWAVTR